MKRVIEALSFTGLVFGIQHTAVNPPRAAASVPVSIVSEFSWPGSRRCTCMSIKPGATTKPEASKASTPESTGNLPGGAISLTRPSFSKTSLSASVFEAGSSTRPFLIRSMSSFLGGWFASSGERRMRAALRGANHQQIQDGHAHGNAVGDLFEHRRLRSVRHFGSDFRATIDRARMQDQCVGLRQAHALGIQLVEQNVVALRKRRFVQTFGLYAQHDDHVGIFERFFHAVHTTDRRSRRPDFFHLARNPHRRAAQGEAAGKLSQQMNVRTSYTRVGNVAENGYVQ